MVGINVFKARLSQLMSMVSEVNRTDGKWLDGQFSSVSVCTYREACEFPFPVSLMCHVTPIGPQVSLLIIYYHYSPSQDSRSQEGRECTFRRTPVTASTELQLTNVMTADSTSPCHVAVS